MIYIADSSVFIIGKRINKKIITVPTVIHEIRDEKSKTMLQVMNVKIESPMKKYIDKVKQKAMLTKDYEELSDTDIDILAKALEYTEKHQTILLSDDYAIQNTAIQLGINIKPISQKIIKDVIIWEKECIGCKRRFPYGKICMICGSELKKTRKLK